MNNLALLLVGVCIFGAGGLVARAIEVAAKTIVSALRKDWL